MRYLAKGTVSDQGEEWTPSDHRDYDCLEWIARLTSYIPDRGTHLVLCYGTWLNAHRGVARRCAPFQEVSPEDKPPDPPQPDSAWLTAHLKIVGAADSPRVRGRPAAVSLRPENARRWLPQPGSRHPQVLAHIGRRFDPLKLPGRSPPLLDDLSPDPFPDYGPQ